MEAYAAVVQADRDKVIQAIPRAESRMRQFRMQPVCLLLDHAATPPGFEGQSVARRSCEFCELKIRVAPEFTPAGQQTEASADAVATAHAAHVDSAEHKQQVQSYREYLVYRELVYPIVSRSLEWSGLLQSEGQTYPEQMQVYVHYHRSALEKCIEELGRLMEWFDKKRVWVQRLEDSQLLEALAALNRQLSAVIAFHQAQVTIRAIAVRDQAQRLHGALPQAQAAPPMPASSAPHSTGAWGGASPPGGTHAQTLTQTQTQTQPQPQMQMQTQTQPPPTATALPWRGPHQPAWGGSGSLGSAAPMTSVVDYAAAVASGAGGTDAGIGDIEAELGVGAWPTLSESASTPTGEPGAVAAGATAGVVTVGAAARAGLWDQHGRNRHKQKNRLKKGARGGRRKKSGGGRRGGAAAAAASGPRESSRKKSARPRGGRSQRSRRGGSDKGGRRASAGERAGK